MALVFFVQMKPVVSLESLIGEFREAYAGVGRKSRLDAISAQHSAQPKVPASSAEEIGDAEGFVPINIIDQPIKTILESCHHL